MSMIAVDLTPEQWRTALTCLTNYRAHLSAEGKWTPEKEDSYQGLKKIIEDGLKKAIQ